MADDPAIEAVPIRSRCNLNTFHDLDLIVVPIRFARLLVGVSKSPLVMDSLVQTILSGNIFIQTQRFQQSMARRTRHNTRGKRRARRGVGEGGGKRQPKEETDTNKGGKGAGAKETVKGDAPPTDVRRKTRTEKRQTRSK